MALKVSAWASWAEWSAVYNQLRSQEASERLLGVQRVQTWRSRVRLPVAIDLTGSYVEIMLNDPQMTPTTAAPRSEHELRMMYSMAVVRLVNGIVDVAQKKGAARSVASLAQQTDWPQWFVDLRHEATHQRLPSLPLLRMAAQEALWLLFERFWQPQLLLLEERGGAQSGASRSTACRDRRLLDRRLRGLAGATSRKHKRLPASETSTNANTNADKAVEENEAGKPTKVAPAVMAARDVAALAADEARLLKRLFAGILSREPRDDGREARAVHLLCASASDNFSVRLAREILSMALGWKSVVLEPVSDNAPSLRNMCDSCDDAVSSTMDDPISFSAPHEAGNHDVDRMFSWLKALLHCDAEDRRRFVSVLVELAPVFRRLVVKRIALTSTDLSRSAASHSERALRVWNEFSVVGVDVGADYFVSLCKRSAGMVDDSSADWIATVENSIDSTISAKLSEAERVLHAQKRQRVELGKNGRVHRKEPWTAVGTTFDPESLGIRCRPERGAATSSLAESIEKWQEWAASAPSSSHIVADEADVATDVAVTSEATAVVARGTTSGEVLLPDGVVSPLREDAPLNHGAMSEGEHRARAAAFFVDLAA